LSGSVDATVRGEPEAWASTDAQVVIVADAGDHYVRALGRFGRAAGHARGKAGVRGLPRLCPRRRPVVDGEDVACGAEVPGHGPAHRAKAEKGYVQRFGHGTGF
jgi:hypothetical protein